LNVIQVENISKLYRLGQVGTGSIFHDVNRWWHGVRGKEDPYMRVGEENDRTKKGKGDYVWALKNINFNVAQGEVLGIIGRNGAGKSTLLKILSRTTAPTTGSIKVKGRIASLLEVGTGFHPELSGRDNIFMNGTILGMTRSEIKSKFDEIVEFAGIARYLDTPVKRYSSGMYVRLAFAVAAHLESEILIVDEVLAVGDAEFQKKCLGKMKDVSERQGRTVLFVSHNMQAIAELSNSILTFEKGEIIYLGLPQQGLQHYFANSGKTIFLKENTDKKIYLSAIYLQALNNEERNIFVVEESILISFHFGFNISRTDHSYKLFVVFLDEFNNPIFSAESSIINFEKCTLKIFPKTLVRGQYKIRAMIHQANKEQIDTVDNMCDFTIIDNSSEFHHHGKYNYGNVFVQTEWIQN
jgi:lipopolysaccharide transport system ATP-binding protein